jgi:hypothetical protein
MSDIRVKPPSPSSSGQTGPKASVELPAGLFGASTVAYRRIDRLTDEFAFIEGGRVARSALGPVKVGQWLRFTKLDGGVEVRVDLEASRRAEGRMADLFQQLKKR